MKKNILITVFAILFSSMFYLLTITSPVFAVVAPQTWQIQSVDTMKTSRDKARDAITDEEIQRQLNAIKGLGANYVAIDTPYDAEFLPYLTRWVNLARSTGLKVWFRGNWSEWEGWFGYEKKLTPDDHLKKTYAFIIENSSLFADEDIFDSCPECENAGHWKQPERDKQYNEFIQAQEENNANAFRAIGKKVYVNMPSIIGGRAKEVLTQETLNDLDNVVAIDHYIKDPKNMGEYIEYFKEHKTKVLVSEFGAPIPDKNGNLTEEEQAVFVDKLFAELYKQRSSVLGANYFVLNFGTTELLNPDYAPRKVYAVVKKYYSPGVLRGTVTNSLGDPISNVEVKGSDGIDVTKTDANGNYELTALPRELTLKVGGGDYTTASAKVVVISGDNGSTHNFSISPITPEALYQIRFFINNIQKEVFSFQE